MVPTKSYVTDDFDSASTAVRAGSVLGASEEHVFDVPRCRRRKLMPAGNLLSGARFYVLIVVLNAIFIAAKVGFASYVTNRLLSRDQHEISKANIVTQSVLTYAAVADILSAAGSIMAILYFFSKWAHKKRGAAIDDESARVVASGLSIAAFVGYACCLGFGVKQHMVGKDGPNEEMLFYLNIAATVSQLATSLASWMGVNPMIAGPCECSADTKPFDRSSSKEGVHIQIPACADAYDRARGGRP